MTVVAPEERRLAGVHFEVAPPPPAAVLPRMDVAGFVGFSASGPVHVPVAVESVAEFEAVFGADAPLAWDTERGEQVSARLAPSVRSFFDNGGRRAWIVRVAGASAGTRDLLIPGLLVAHGKGLERATLPARSPGRWADQIRAVTSLTTTPVLVESIGPARFKLETFAGSSIQIGDLVRFRNDGYELLAVVSVVAPDAGTASPPRPSVTKLSARGRSVVEVEIDPATALWIDRTSPPAGPGPATFTTAGGVLETAQAGLADWTSPPSLETLEPRLSIRLESQVDPATGSFVQLDDPIGGTTLWLVVEASRPDPDDAGAQIVTGRPISVLAQPPVGVEFDFAEVLTFELRAEVNATDRRVLAGLGFAPAHARYVGSLPSDRELYGRVLSDAGIGPAPRLYLGADPSQPLVYGPSDLSPPVIWAEVETPRFPLAGATRSLPVYYPIGMTGALAPSLGPLAVAEPPIVRDGLARFGDDLFLDPALRLAGTEVVLATADDIRYVQEPVRPLIGIHSLLAVDEVTIVSVPDAGHRRWRRAKPAAVPAAPRSERLPRPPKGGFDDCSWRILESPKLAVVGSRRPESYSVVWTSVEGGDTRVRYRLERSTNPHTWAGAAIAYEGSDTELDVYGSRPGIWFYRVRASLDDNLSEWSDGLAVRVADSDRRVLERRSRYRPDALIAIQRALLRMCAARGDLLCTLALPEHYRADEAIAHVGALSALELSRAGGRSRLDPVRPLDASEARALSHGALYHPWLYAAPPDTPDRVVSLPPDGAAAGVLGKRAATRGAWVAPANEPMVGVVALTPRLPADRLLPLLTAQVNVVRQEPSGFVCLSQDTLAMGENADVRPVNVRRLLCLLRRLVLLRGTEYVFEPNDATLRRGIQRGFEEVLGRMFLLGAFAGDVAERSFQVVVGDPPNTAQSVDAGRLIVELKVAPSRPLSFLTVRLLQLGDRGLAVEAP